jgi:hypothetical protein
VLTDLNHDPRRAEQWTKAKLQSLPDGVHADHFMEQIGDVGAATTPALLALAFAAWQLETAPAASALIATHSNDAERGVVLVRGVS